MIGSKIKALLNLRNKNINSLCEFIKILPPAMYRKLSKNTFKSEELIKIAEFTNTNLSFTDKETGKILISFDSDDIKKDTQS